MLGLSFHSSKLGGPCGRLSGSHGVAGDGPGAWRKTGCVGVGLHCYSPEHQPGVGVHVDEETYSGKSARPDFQEQREARFSNKGVDKMTFQEPSQLEGTSIIENGHLCVF